LISIVIVNWNGKQYIGDCLRSIQKNVSQPYEVIIVDNNSTDGSADLIAESFPWVKLIRSTENLGFGRGNNLAAKHANGDTFLLLNLDTVLLADPSPIAHALVEDDTIGCIGAKMCNAAGTVVTNAGHFPSALRLVLFISMFWKPYKGRGGPARLNAERVDWVEGSWVLMRRQVWDKVGGFDDRIFMYVEDVDICKRIADVGLMVIQVPTVAYCHYGGLSVHRLPYLFAGFRFYIRKHSSGLERVLAEGMLFFGLKARLLCYGAVGLLSQSEQIKEKASLLRKIDRSWNRPVEHAVGNQTRSNEPALNNRRAGE